MADSQFHDRFVEETTDAIKAITSTLRALQESLSDIRERLEALETQEPN